MNVRGKLVELLNGIIDGGFKWHSYSYESGEQLNNDEIASHLITHGVTVSEWISVKDRLPDSTTVNLHTRSGTVGTGFYDKRIKRWVQYYSGGPICVDVTHWMPMPKPPKEEEE